MGVRRSDAEVELPPPLLGCGECVQVTRRHSVLGGIVLRAELAELARLLVLSYRFGDQGVELGDRVLRKRVGSVDLLEERGVRTVLDFLNDEGGIAPRGWRIDPV